MQQSVKDDNPNVNLGFTFTNETGTMSNEMIRLTKSVSG